MAFPIDIIVRASIPAIIFGLFALFRRYFQTPDRDTELASEADTSIPSVVAVNACMIAIGLLFAFCSHTLLVGLNKYFAHRVPNIELILYPSTAIWWFFPGFGALALSWEITFQIWTKFNPVQAEAYRAYSNLKSGFDSTKVLRWMGILLALPIGFFTLLAVPIHSTLTTQGIWDGHYASSRQKVFLYSDVVQMTQFDGYLIRDGSFQKRAGILLRFKDGRSWNSADTDDPKATVDPALLNLLIKRVPVQTDYTHIEPK